MLLKKSNFLRGTMEILDKKLAKKFIIYSSICKALKRDDYDNDGYIVQYSALLYYL